MPKTVLAQLGLGGDALPGADMFALAEDARRVRMFRSLLDTNWRESRRLAAATEYAVSGFSWLASSWSATGRVFGSSAEALEVFRRLSPRVDLGPLTASARDGGLPGMIVTNEATLLVYPPARAVAPGDFASVSLPIGHLRPGRRYHLAVDVTDRCPRREPGRFEQRLWLDQELIYRHDIAGDDFAGTRRIRWRFLPRSSQVTLRAELRALDPPAERESWGSSASIGIGRLVLRPLDP